MPHSQGGQFYIELVVSDDHFVLHLGPMIVLSPGPCAMWPEVKQALVGAPLHHRSALAQHILQQVQMKLRRLFQTREPVFLMHSTGRGAMEAALINSLTPGATLGVVVSGYFGQVWAQMAEHLGFKVHRLLIPWGQAVVPEQIEQFLRRYKLKALLCQAVETSTGVQHPIQHIAEVLQSRDALFMVDAISALGIQPLKMDAWHIDVLVGASQKALALPAGLAFVSFSQKARRQPQYTARRSPTFYKPMGSFYFNLQARQYKTQNFSVAMPMIQALNLSLNRVQPASYHASYQYQAAKWAQQTRSFLQLQLQPRGFEFFTNTKLASPALTVLCWPKADDAIQRLAHSYGVQVAGGQGPLKNKVIRIGHMGYIKQSELEYALKALTQCYKSHSTVI